MHYDLILKNGTLVTPLETIKGDVAVKDGKIVKTGNLEASDTADEIYDAEGKHILPGIIDAHVHFRDPGLTEKEDFESGSIAAVIGGITMVADMPNVIPVTSSVECFNEKVNIAKEKSYVDFAFFALLTNDNLNEMEEFRNAGVLGFKVFFGTSTGDLAAPSPEILIKQMDKCESLGLRIGFHAESNDLNSSFTSVAKIETDEPDGFWLDYARPVLSELKAIQFILSYALETKIKIHIHHVTSEDSVLFISEAKDKKDINVTTETCPHYLLLNCEQHTHKVYPPIRDENHQNALWEAITNKKIDMIASDHAPHKVSEKSKITWESPAGLSGVETSVPLMLNEVNKGSLSINDYVRLASEMPKKYGVFIRKREIFSLEQTLILPLLI